MTEFQLKRRAVRLWANPMVPRSTVRHNRRAWLASVLRLGDKWLGNPMDKELLKERSKG